MARIQPTGAGDFRRYRKSSSKKSESDVRGVHRSSFSELWEAETSEPASAGWSGLHREIEENLESLVDDVHTYGERLKERPTYENIRSYKEAVRDFLSYVITNTLEVETKEGSRFNPLKKQRKYTLVKIIDEKLEHLASGIMQNQGAQLDILRRVEEINGLVVDLLS